MNNFLIRLWHAAINGFLCDNQRQPTQWLDWEEAPKYFPKTNLHTHTHTHTQKVIVIVWWSDASLIHYSFLNPGETITSEKYAQQINEIHQKLRCLQPTLVNTEGPILLHSNAWPRHTTNTWKVEEIGLQSFASSTIFTWPLVYRLPLLRASWLFLQGNASTISKRQKMLSKSSSNPEAWMFMLQE